MPKWRVYLSEFFTCLGIFLWITAGAGIGMWLGAVYVHPDASKLLTDFASAWGLVGVTICAPLGWLFGWASRKVDVSSPRDGYGVKNLAPQLSWKPCKGATSYSLGIASDDSFGTLLIDEKQLVDNNYHVPLNILTSKTEYYWRVDAQTDKGIIRLFLRTFKTPN